MQAAWCGGLGICFKCSASLGSLGREQGKNVLLGVQGSEAVFEKQCAGNPCCGTSLNSSKGSSLKFSDYKRLCLKWQQAVVAALRIALSSKEYVQTRNALLFLSYNSKVRIYLTGCYYSVYTEYVMILNLHMHE